MKGSEIMARYIDADALTDELISYAEANKGTYHSEGFKNAVTVVEDQPTADVVERKKGKWLNKFVDGLGFNGLEFECSECGKRSAGRTNYCAYCGAEMYKYK